MAESLERIAEVYINLKAGRLRNTFSYRIPQEFSFVGPGWRVIVPFGSRNMEGFVWETRTAAPQDCEELKFIGDAPDDSAWFDASMLTLARWLSEYYVCTRGEALSLFIPGKTGVRAEQYYQALLENQPLVAEPVYDFIRARGAVAFHRLRSEFGAPCRADLLRLQKAGLIIAKRKLEQKSTVKWQNVLRLAINEQAARDAASAMRGKPARQRLLIRLAEAGTLPLTRAAGGVAFDSAVKALIQAGLVKLERQRISRDTYAHVQGLGRPVTATPDQEKALSRIVPAIARKQHQSFLLHGATGSGKTEVYLQATAAALSAGRQALVLIPEIAQTHQLLRRFKARFGPGVAVVHSKLSLGERLDAWDKFRDGTADIVIGTRSALFVPAHDLGLIIVDEEHEFTYKQEETPRYHVRDTALKRAALVGATVIFGSATPSLETYRDAEIGRHTLLELPCRIDGSSLPSVEIVDMREQLKQGRKKIISAPLEQLLQDTINKGEQAILLLNRRGYSTFVLCRECGHVMRCQHCNVPLVYHLQDGKLRCHYCDASQASPSTCPACHSRYIRYFGAGTQRLEEELTNLFPGVRLARLDQDTTGKKGSTDRILEEFRAGRQDILLGTQMVAKGHDIEKVTAVGIMAADSILNLPDFRAAEQTFALIMQAAGRAGRGSLPGRVIVQTYHPEHYAVHAGAAQDYALFCRQEIAYRRELGYPPFSHLIKLTVSGAEEVATMRRAYETAELLQECLKDRKPPVDIVGPFAAPMAKLGDVFRIHILLHGEDLTDAKQVLTASGLSGARDISLDIDPLSMM